MPLTRKEKGKIFCLNVYSFKYILFFLFFSRSVFSRLGGRGASDSQTRLSIEKVEGRITVFSRKLRFLSVYISNTGSVFLHQLLKSVFGATLTANLLVSLLIFFGGE